MRSALFSRALAQLALVAILTLHAAAFYQIPITRNAPVDAIKSARRRRVSRRDARRANPDVADPTAAPGDGRARRIALLQQRGSRRNKEAAPDIKSKENSATTNEKKHSRDRSLSVASQPFISCDDIIYYSSIQLGGPSEGQKQTMQVILDTGSSDLWVFSSMCSNCDPSTDRYDHSKSNDFVANNNGFTIE